LDVRCELFDAMVSKEHRMEIRFRQLTVLGVLLLQMEHYRGPSKRTHCIKPIRVLDFLAALVGPRFHPQAQTRRHDERHNFGRGIQRLGLLTKVEKTVSFRMELLSWLWLVRWLFSVPADITGPHSEVPSHFMVFGIFIRVQN